MLQAMHSISLMQEISPQKFSSDVKLLLFGIDSDSFKYNTVVRMQSCALYNAIFLIFCNNIIFLFQIGFKLEENISVHGINSETLKITCQEAICWGNSFKSLLLLVTPDPQTGKLQQNGLIFKVYNSSILYITILCNLFLLQFKYTIGVGDVC